MKQLFLNKIKAPYFIFPIIIFFYLSVSLDKYFSSEYYDQTLYKHFQKQFLDQQKLLEQRTENLLHDIQTGDTSLIFSDNIQELNKLVDDKNMYLFLFHKDSMLIWPDNRIAEAEILPAIIRDNQLIQLANGWFYAHLKIFKEYKIIGLLLLKNNYSIQNKYLSNNFNRVFKFPDEINIKPRSLKDKFKIINEKGKPVFSLDFNKKFLYEGWNRFLVVFCFTISILLLLILYGKIILNQTDKKKRLFIIIAGGIILLLLKYFMVHFKYPVFIYKLALFQPVHFAISNFLPSLGDLFIIACIIYIIVFLLYKEFSLSTPIKHKNKFLLIIIPILFLSLVLLYFLFANELFESVIYNSNISFDIQYILNIGFLSIFGFLSIALLFGVFIILSDFVIIKFFQDFTFLKTVIIIYGTVAVIFISYYLKSKDFDIANLFLIIFAYAIIIYIKKFKNQSYRYSNIVLLVFIFSMYSVYVIYQVAEGRSLNEKKVMAANIASEHDPVAEYLLFEMGQSINSDTTLHRLALQKKIDYPWIYKYVRKKFFSGYWERYDLQITLCRPNDSLLIKPEIVYKPCYSFFKKLISHNSEIISGTNFYFMKSPEGRISYFSAINYSGTKTGISANVYLQLDTKILTEELGYPELLLDGRFARNNRKIEYSYAKYYKNNLVSQVGDFSYNLNSNLYQKPKGEYSLYKFEGYEHLFYMPDNNNLLILSKPEVKLFDLLVIFSYIFIFYFIFLNLILSAASNLWVKVFYKNDFKTKIRYSIIGILIFTFISVGSITIYFIVKQYKNKYYDSISEKLQSVYLELENILSQEKSISFTWSSYEYSNLEDLLRKLSNVFYTDINLYDPNGRMIASSRPEIFEKGLTGNYMNPMAYFQLAKNENTEFTQNEKIGNLEYLSIYSPFMNYQDHLLAYLNLPYFTRQNELTREISSLMLAIINFYVLLILLSLILAVLVSESITRPLWLIKDKFAKIKLGTRNEKILYEKDDEIGDLVIEYNRMIDELGRSVELLARSERESAWREMAKQVAHEIKNPLTPMKLSIQQLQRAWNDKTKNIDEYFTRVTKTLIDQIENLSTIATEFSNFAKMPRTNNEKIDLNILIENVINLFTELPIQFRLNYNKDLLYTVFADREQLSRVLINLVTNSIQAIPDDRKGLIEITLTREENLIITKIQDNGIGISIELTDKLFQPNFTTKSGGMGLGLAISKNIIEYAGGSIHFETLSQTGSTFIITLPLA